MLTTLEGTYKDGKVELEEAPTGITEGRVLVTFLPNGNGGTSTPKSLGQMVYFGMFAGPVQTDEEDFKIAAFRGDPDDGLDWP